MLQRIRTVPLILALLMGGTAAIFAAAPDPAFSYRGRLEQDGAPVNTARTIRIRLYSQDSGGSPMNPAFTFPGTQVSGGEFQVNVGPLTDEMLAADPLYVEVTVDGEVLLGRQRIFAAPHALRGRSGGNPFVSNASITVEGDELRLGTRNSPGTRTQQRALTHGAGDALVINRGGDFEGNVVVESSLAANGVMVGGGSAWPTNNVISFSRQAGDDAYAGQIGFRVDGDNALSMVGAGADGSRAIKLWDNVTIQKRLTAPNTQATAWCDCQDLYEVDGVAGTNGFLFTTQGWNQCRANRYLVGIYLTGGSCGNNVYCLENYRCCRPCNLQGN